MFSFTADGTQSAEATQTINTVVLQEVVSAGCHPDTDINVTRIAIIWQTRIFPKPWVSDKEWTIWVYYDTSFKLWLLLQSACPNHHLIKSVISLHRASKITLVNKGLASLKKNKFERAGHQFYGWSWASLAPGYRNSFAFSCILNMK